MIKMINALFWLVLIVETGPEQPSEGLLTWQYVQDRLPWGVILLLGFNWINDFDDYRLRSTLINRWRICGCWRFQRIRSVRLDGRAADGVKWLATDGNHVHHLPCHFHRHWSGLKHGHGQHPAANVGRTGTTTHKSQYRVEIIWIFRVSPSRSKWTRSTWCYPQRLLVRTLSCCQ